VALSRAGATRSKGLTLDRWRRADEALEIIAWMLGSLVNEDERAGSVIDPISGAYTQAFFEEVLSNELARHTRHAAELAVIMVQLRCSSPPLADQLPSPALLALIAKVLSDTLRTSDLVARIGSRRFGVMMSSTNPREGLMAANRLGETLRDLEKLKGWSIDIGISGVGLEMANPEELLAQAEHAMRAAEQRRAQHPYVYF